jgi:hypothetical protein
MTVLHGWSMALKGPVSRRDEPDKASEWTPVVYCLAGKTFTRYQAAARKRKPGKAKVKPPKPANSALLAGSPP